MKIPEIDRDLQHADPKVRYWIKYQQEQLNAIQMQLDQAAELLLKFYLVLENLQNVNSQLRTELMEQGIDHDAVEKAVSRIKDAKGKDPNMVKSVLNHPDDED